MATEKEKTLSAGKSSLLDLYLPPCGLDVALAPFG